MKFLIVSHAELKKTPEGIYGYAPYIREMNLWFKYVEEVEIVSPLSAASVSAIDMALDHPKISLTAVPAFSLTSLKAVVQTIFKLPGLFRAIYRAMKRADHIHLRCPGNMGLLGSIVQIAFPGKKKTAKYAGNWDWKSKQPWSYRLQQRILRNTWLSRNMRVLVYGHWADQTKNMVPFFTATYRESDRKNIDKPPIDKGVNLIFIGGLTLGKRPELAVQVLRELKCLGINARLTICGDGEKRAAVEERVLHEKLSADVDLLGNVSSERVKTELQNAHFLLFASKSEGWPKVVAEAMWWGCIPITTAVSCVPEMVGNGQRGQLVAPLVSEITNTISRLLEDTSERENMKEQAELWSREYTLERFESEIKTMIL
ncbi:MAG: glycosyltransferase family 4 protein [bacterium]|nr:glycosyltransferase family 4 protein [bacterium]